MTLGTPASVLKTQTGGGGSQGHSGSDQRLKRPRRCDSPEARGPWRRGAGGVQCPGRVWRAKEVPPT